MERIQQDKLQVFLTEMVDYLIEQGESAELIGLYDKYNECSYAEEQQRHIEIIRTLAADIFDVALDVQAESPDQLMDHLHDQLHARDEKRARRRKSRKKSEKTGGGDLLALLRLQLQIEQLDSQALEGLAEERLANYNRVLQEQSQRLQQEIYDLTQPFLILDIHPRGLTQQAV